MPHRLIPMPFAPFAGESLTVSTTELPLTAATWKPTDGPHAVAAYIVTEDQPVKWTVDGTTPTAAIGHEAPAGTEIVLLGARELANFQVIRSGGTDAVIYITYFRI